MLGKPSIQSRLKKQYQKHQLSGNQTFRKTTIHLKTASDIYNEILKMPLRELKKIQDDTTINKNMNLKIKQNKSSIKLNTNRNSAKDEIQQYFFNNSTANKGAIKTDRQCHTPLKSVDITNRKISGGNNRMKTEISVQEIKQYQFKEIVTELEQQNRRIKLSITKKRNEFVQIKAQILLKFIEEFVKAKENNKYLNEELNFYKNETKNEINTIFRALAP